MSLTSICRFCTNFTSCLHFFLYCSMFPIKRLILLSIVINIDSKLLDYGDLCLTKALLFCNILFDDNTKLLIFDATIEFIISSKRFDAVTIFCQNLFCILFSFILMFFRALYICFFIFLFLVYFLV